MPYMLNPLAYLGEAARSLSLLSLHLFSYICCYQLQFSFSSLEEILFPFPDLVFIFCNHWVGSFTWALGAQLARLEATSDQAILQYVSPSKSQVAIK